MFTATSVGIQAQALAFVLSPRSGILVVDVVELLVVIDVVVDIVELLVVVDVVDVDVMGGLKTPMPGAQTLDMLSQIQGCTYERPDLDQRRLGLIADEVEEAIEQFATGNIVGSKWHDEAEYKTFDHSRLVALLIPAVHNMSKRIHALESKADGTVHS